MNVLEPVAETTLTNAFGNPVNSIVILDKAKDELAYTVAEFQFSNLEETIVQILLHGDRIVAIGTEDMADLIEIAEEDCRKGPLPDIKLVKDVKNEVKESTGLFHFLRKKF